MPARAPQQPGAPGSAQETAGPAELDAPPSFDPEDPPHAGAPAAFATEGGAGGGVVEAARVAGNDACSIKTNERRAPGGNCWRKGAKSSPSSNAARITAKAASRSAGEKDMARPGGDATECLVTEKATSSRDSCRHDESLMSMRTRVCYTTSNRRLSLVGMDAPELCGCLRASAMSCGFLAIFRTRIPLRAERTSLFTECCVCYWGGVPAHASLLG